MKKWLLPLLIAGFVIVGCENTNKPAVGALVGGGLGAGIGAIAGGGPGAAIGAGVGVVTGALVGAALDSNDRESVNKTSPATVQKMDNGQPLGVPDIIKLAQSGVSDDTIIRYIQDSKTKYSLSDVQINQLEQGGVSRRVINFMINTGR
jgi:outer membrane lipoprotein SlyB